MRPPLFPALSLALSISACGVMPQAQCSPDEKASVSEMLYFGTSKRGGVVSQAQWSAFLAEVVTPRFPEGLTVWPASGQWQSANGAIAKEDSFVLNLVHAPDADADRKIGAIVAEYKHRFQQEAVLRVKSAGCSSL